MLSKSNMKIQKKNTPLYSFQDPIFYIDLKLCMFITFTFFIIEKMDMADPLDGLGYTSHHRQLLPNPLSND